MLGTAVKNAAVPFPIAERHVFGRLGEAMEVELKICVVDVGADGREILVGRPAREKEERRPPSDRYGPGRGEIPRLGGVAGALVGDDNAGLPRPLLNVALA